MTKSEAHGSEVSKALSKAAAGLPKHEQRPQQLAMAEAVAKAVKQRRHLIVQAGTGTGKSLAYLVPTLLLGARVVVSTATKALQDQLAMRDLPRLAESSGLRFDYAVLKGRSNYICRQRLAELFGAGEQMTLGDGAEVGTAGAAELGRLGRELRRLADWVKEYDGAESVVGTTVAGTGAGTTGAEPGKGLRAKAKPWPAQDDGGTLRIALRAQRCRLGPGQHQLAGVPGGIPVPTG